MGYHVHLHGEGDRTAVVKVATAAHDIGRLESEACWLRRLRHPGVVEIIDLVADPEGTRLLTVYAGAATLADHRPGTVEGVTALMAAVATVAADLHAVGVAHGAIDASHVVLNEARRPVLCSFGQASRADEAAVAADVAALAVLATGLIERCPAPDGLVARWHDARRRRYLLRLTSSSTSAAELAAGLAGLRPRREPHHPTGHPIGHAAESDPEATLAIGANADSINHDEPAAEELSASRTWRHRVAPAARRHARPVPMRRRPTAAAVGLLALGALGAAAVLSSTAGPQAERTTGRLAELVTDVALTASAQPQPASTRTPTAVTAAPVGDACPADVAPCTTAAEVHGTLVRLGATWFEVGRPGDVVVVGDWDCDGIPTPAVLRPASGEVFVFARWAPADEPLRVAATAVVPGAAGLEARHSGRCDRLHPLDPAGNAAEVPVEVS